MCKTNIPNKEVFKWVIKGPTLLSLMRPIEYKFQIGQKLPINLSRYITKI